MKKLLLFMAPALLLAGCARELAPSDAPEVRDETPILTSDELKFLSMVGRDTKFDQQNIDRIVGDVVGFMESTPATRSAGTRSVAEIRPLAVTIPASSVGTRSDEMPENSEEELFYLVNFDDNQGYSIIAADSRIRDEIALFVGHGNLDENEVENPGLAVMLSRLDDYAARSIAEYEAWCDSVEVSMMARIAEDYAELADEIAAYLDSLEQGESGTRIDPLPEYENEYEVIDTEYVYGPWTTQTQVEPMIPVEWNQGGMVWKDKDTGEKFYVDWPFNRAVELYYSSIHSSNPDYIADLHAQSNPQYIPAGCVAIAVAQLMAYWQWPTSYHGLSGGNIDWDALCEWSGYYSDYSDGYREWSGTMLSAPADVQILCASLILHIGLDVKMEYDVGGSGADSADAIDLLEDLGYTVSSKQNYNYNAALASVNAGRPVLMDGYSHRTENGIFGINLWYTYQNSHTWLIDGYLKQQQAVTVTYTWHPILNNPTPITRTRVLPEAFTTTETYNYSREFFHNNFGWNGTDNGYYVPGIFDASSDGNSADLPSNTRSGEDGNYQYDLEMWTNIHN
jgi:hypothetical protein